MVKMTMTLANMAIAPPKTPMSKKETMAITSVMIMIKMTMTMTKADEYDGSILAKWILAPLQASLKTFPIPLICLTTLAFPSNKKQTWLGLLSNNNQGRQHDLRGFKCLSVSL